MTEIIRQPSGELADSTEAELIRDWLSNRAPRTIETYKEGLAAFARWAGLDQGRAVRWFLSLPGPEAYRVALRWRGALEAQGLATATVAIRLTALRSLVALAKRVGACPWELGDDLVPKREPVKDTAGPPDEVYLAMLRVAVTRAKPERNEAILRLLRERGLRRGEVAGLAVDDLVFSLSRLVGVRIKPKGQRGKANILLAKQTRGALRRWLEVRGMKSGSLFGISGRGIHEMVRLLAGLTGLGVRVSPHSLRHAAITAAYRVTKDPLATQRFARHVRFDQTSAYIDNADGLGDKASQALADDLEKLTTGEGESDE